MTNLITEAKLTSFKAHKGMNVIIFLIAVFIVPPNIKIKMKLKTTNVIEVETSQNTALIRPALPKIP